MQATATPRAFQSDTLEPFPDQLPTKKKSARKAEQKTDITIAYIGGGSRAWAVMLMRDLALSENLEGELRLYDIDHAASVQNEELGKHVFTHAESRTKFRVRAVQSLAETLRGADFVVISIEPGPTTMRYADLEIPAKYGILQTVGDTTGPGGLLRAMRSVPIFQGFANAVMEHCPKAWVINYTNPMALCTAALSADHPGIKTFGCCHEVFGTQRMLAQKVAQWFDTEIPDRAEIALDITGVNHFTWATKAAWRGNDLMPLVRKSIEEENFFADRTEEAKKAISESKWFGSAKLVAHDLFRRFGALGAAGDRHLVEFVPWYLSSEAELHRWGVVRTPYSWRLERSTSERTALKEVTDNPLTPSGEEGVQQIEALLGINPFITNVNLPNEGQIPWLPKGTLVETYADFGHDRLRPLMANDLPAGAQTLVRRVADEQNLTLQACREKNLDLAFQALLSDPLVHISADQAQRMFGEMVEATREMLDGWK